MDLISLERNLSDCIQKVYIDDKVFTFIVDSNCNVSNYSIAPRITTSLIISEKTDLFVYPNPTKEVLQIQMKKPFSIVKIHDMMGRLWKDETTTFGTVNVKSLPNGNYILTISDGIGNLYSRKFIKN